MTRTRKAVELGDEPAALALTGIFGHLLSPITWVHHLVWVFPAVLLLTSHALDGQRAPRVRRRLVIATVVAYALLSSRVVWAFEYQYDGFGVIGSNVYVFVLCGFLAGLPLARGSRPPSAVAGDAIRPPRMFRIWSNWIGRSLRPSTPETRGCPSTRPRNHLWRLERHEFRRPVEDLSPGGDRPPVVYVTPKVDRFIAFVERQVSRAPRWAGPASQPAGWGLPSRIPFSSIPPRCGRRRTPYAFCGS